VYGLDVYGLDAMAKATIVIEKATPATVIIELATAVRMPRDPASPVPSRRDHCSRRLVGSMCLSTSIKPCARTRTPNTRIAGTDQRLEREDSKAFAFSPSVNESSGDVGYKGSCLSPMHLRVRSTKGPRGSHTGTPRALPFEFVNWHPRAHWRQRLRLRPTRRWLSRNHDTPRCSTKIRSGEGESTRTSNLTP
jgi:hypothetical protein